MPTRIGPGIKIGQGILIDTPAFSANTLIINPTIFLGNVVSLPTFDSVGGGVAPYTYSVTGTLPTGLSYNTSTGVISGTAGTKTPKTSLVFRVTDSVGYAVTNFANIAVKSATVPITYLVVGSGGGGGSSSGNLPGSLRGGGGGGGGVVTGNISLTTDQVYVATVSAGGANNSNGGETSFTGVTPAVGGGAGGGGGNTGTPGGSGGGGGQYPAYNVSAQIAGGTGTAGQGSSGGVGFNYNWFYGGGGGGAGAAGNTGTANPLFPASIGGGGTGGIGRQVPAFLGFGDTRSPASLGYFGGGGNGSIGNGGNPIQQLPVSGGGGTPASYSATTGANPTSYPINGWSYTGGGGGGGNPVQTVGGSGGSGVVLLKIPTVDYSGVYGPAPAVDVSTSGSDTILQFTSSGTYTA